jgi:uncharacterized protein YacL
MNTLIIIIVTVLLTKYGYFNAKQMKEDITKITQRDIDSWKKVNKEYKEYKKDPESYDAN